MTTKISIANSGPNKVCAWVLHTGASASAPKEKVAPTIIEPGRFLDVLYVHSGAKIVVEEMSS